MGKNKRLLIAIAAVTMAILLSGGTVFADEPANGEPAETSIKETIMNFIEETEETAEISNEATEGTAEISTEKSAGITIKETALGFDYDMVVSVVDQYLIVEKDEKIGVIDESGKVILPCEFDYDYYDYSYNLYQFCLKLQSEPQEEFSFLLRKDGKYGVVKSTGEIVSEFKYDDFMPVYSETDGNEYWRYSSSSYSAFDSNGLAIVKIKGKGWGVVNSDGAEVVSPQYNSIADFKEGRAAVERFELYGFIDTEGKEIISCEYDQVYAYNDGFAMVMVMDGSYTYKYGFLNEAGELAIPCIYDDAVPFTDGLAYISLDGTYGFIDKSGKMVMELPEGMSVEYYYWWWDEATAFTDDLLVVSQYVGTGYDDYNYEYNYDYDYAYDDYYYSLYKYGYIDWTGTLVIPCIYDNARPFTNGFAAVAKDGKYGIIDKQGNMVLDFQYEYIGEFYNGVAEVYDENGNMGLINEAGQLVIAPEYDYLWYYYSDLEYIEVEKGEKSGVADLEGNLVVPCEYSYVRDEGNGLFIVSDENYNNGVYSANEAALTVPCEYGYIGSFYETEDGTYIAATYKEGYYGVITEKGEVIIPFTYADIYLFDHVPYALALNDAGYYGLIDLENNVAAPFEYVNVMPLSDNKASALKDDGQWYQLEILWD